MQVSKIATMKLLSCARLRQINNDYIPCMLQTLFADRTSCYSRKYRFIALISNERRNMDEKRRTDLENLRMHNNYNQLSEKLLSNIIEMQRMEIPFAKFVCERTMFLQD